MADRGPGADSECLSQRGGGPSIFLLVWKVAGDIPQHPGTFQGFWGHLKASGDIPKLLGPGACGNHSILPEARSGVAGPSWHQGLWPLLPLGTELCGSLGRAGDSEQMRHGLQGGQGVFGGSPGSQRDPQSCPHPPGINSCWERTEGISWRRGKDAPCAKAVLVARPGQVTMAVGGCWGHPR